MPEEISEVRCTYCDHVHKVQKLPYDCPNCGHDFKVISRGPFDGSTISGRAGNEIVAREDRAFMDYVDKASEAEGVKSDCDLCGACSNCERCGQCLEDERKGAVICSTCTGERGRGMWAAAEYKKWPHGVTKDDYPDAYEEGRSAARGHSASLKRRDAAKAAGKFHFPHGITKCATWPPWWPQFEVWQQGWNDEKTENS